MPIHEGMRPWRAHEKTERNVLVSVLGVRSERCASFKDVLGSLVKNWQSHAQVVDER